MPRSRGPGIRGEGRYGAMAVSQNKTNESNQLLRNSICCPLCRLAAKSNRSGSEGDPLSICVMNVPASGSADAMYTSLLQSLMLLEHERVCCRLAECRRSLCAEFCRAHPVASSC